MTPEEYLRHAKNIIVNPNCVNDLIAVVKKDMDMINENLQFIIVEEPQQKILDEFKAKLSSLLLGTKNYLSEQGIVGKLAEIINYTVVSAMLLMHHKFMPGDIPELCAFHTKQLMESYDLVRDIEWDFQKIDLGQ